jgi:hypothetical protein
MQTVARVGLMVGVAWLVGGCDAANGEDWQQRGALAEQRPEATREIRGLLGFGEEGAVKASFTRDLETHAWVFEAPRGAVVELLVRQDGPLGAMVAARLDTNLTVFGPQRVGGGFGEVPVGHDDDSGGAGDPWLEDLLLPQGGRAGEAAVWLVVVGTNEDRGRGSYRLTLRCPGGQCEGPHGDDVAVEPLAEVRVGDATCPEALARDVIGCLGGLPGADLAEPWGDGFEGALEACAGPGRVAAWCGRRTAGCGAGQGGVVDACRRDVRRRLVDQACVFGRRFETALEAQEGVLVTAETQLREVGAVGALDVARLRWLNVLVGGDHPEALTLAGGGVTRHAMWDASGREALEALTVSGPSGPSGAVFYRGSEAMAAEVRDGVIVGCGLRFGGERRRCRGAEDCETGLRCVGLSGGWGRCVDSLADTQKHRDLPCSGDADCGEGEGLICAGLGLREHGRCVPAWHRGRFLALDGGQIPDADVGGKVIDLPAFGLPGAAADLRVALKVEHPRIRDLRVTLENVDHGGPEGWGEVVVFAGERDGEGLVLDWSQVPRIGRDQPAAGRWRLRVQDLASGARGHVVSAGLEVTGL